MQPFNALSAIRSALYRFDFCVVSVPWLQHLLCAQRRRRRQGSCHCSFGYYQKPTKSIDSVDVCWLCWHSMETFFFLGWSCLSCFSFTLSNLLLFFYFISLPFKWTFSFDFAGFMVAPSPNKHTHALIYLIYSSILPLSFLIDSLIFIQKCLLFIAAVMYHW